MVMHTKRSQHALMISVFVALLIGVMTAGAALAQDPPIEAGEASAAEGEASSAKDEVSAVEGEASSALPPGTPRPGGDVDKEEERFRFGAYGRVQPSVDDNGTSGKRARIVYPSPRVDEGSYTELEFRFRAFRDKQDGLEVDTVTTIALTDDIFHFDGEFDSTIAVRNLFAEARNLFYEGIFVWVGSRMYRGDDVYLLDFWPLDNLNTYGGGLGWFGPRTWVGWHFGVNKLNNDYQSQTIEVPDERGIGSREVIFLDRQRFITSLKAEQLFYDEPSPDGGRNPGFKVKVYSEFHSLPEGEFRQEQPQRDDYLPDDHGWVAGVQLGAWDFIPGAKRSFFNLFLRYAAGLAAYGEFSVPFGVDEEKRAADADDFMLAFSANIDARYFGVMLGGYARYFLDADKNVEDFDDGWSMAYAIRPMAFIGKYFTPGFEVSYQGRRPNGVNPASGKQSLASIWKLSLLPAVTFGDSMYARPQIRLNYTVSFQDDAARALYAIDDPRRSKDVVHFIGLAVEWWYSSSSYR